MLNCFKESVKVGKKGLLFQLYNIIGDDGSNVPDKKSGGSVVASVLSV